MSLITNINHFCEVNMSIPADNGYHTLLERVELVEPTCLKNNSRHSVCVIPVVSQIKIE